MAVLHKVIADIHDLSLEDKEYVSEQIKKILIEARREKIFQDGKQALRDYKAGKSQKGSAKELLADLND